MKKPQQAAQRKESKKKFFFIFASFEQCLGFLFFIVVITICSWSIITVKNWIDDPERVVLSQLTLSGDNQFTTKQDVRKAILDLGLPNTYIGQNVDSIQQEILRLPWIQQVSVRKQWPDRLIIHVIEYKPKYLWNEVYFLDSEGNLFNIPSGRFQDVNLPKLFGPIGKEKLILNSYQQLETISNTLSKKGKQLFIYLASADERNAWQLLLKPCFREICASNQDIKVILGREHINDRFKRFIRFYGDIQADIPSNERISEVDLRYDNGIAVKRQKNES